MALEPILAPCKSAKGRVIFINLGDTTESTQPMIIKVEGFLDKEINIDLDPNYIADFTGKID